MTKAIAQTYNTANQYTALVTRAFLVVCAFLIALYGFNIYKVVRNTVAMEQIQKQTVEMSAKIDALNSQYLTLSSQITPDNLKEYGLSETKVSVYVSRSASLGSVALRDHEL
jgi:cell division protein FtsB